MGVIEMRVWHLRMRRWFLIYLGTMMQENCRYFDTKFENTKDDMTVHIEDGLESKYKFKRERIINRYLQEWWTHKRHVNNFKERRLEVYKYFRKQGGINIFIGCWNGWCIKDQITLLPPNSHFKMQESHNLLCVSLGAMRAGDHCHHSPQLLHLGKIPTEPRGVVPIETLSSRFIN